MMTHRRSLSLSMERIKEPIQSASWADLEIDEQIEQLIDVNDTFFERIVSENGEMDTGYLILILSLGIGSGSSRRD